MSLAPPLLSRRPLRLSPVLPVVLVIALLALPLAPDGEGGAGPADVASALVVVCCVLRLLRQRRRPLSRTAAVVLGLPVVGCAVAAMGAASPGAGLAGLGRYLQIFVLVPAAVLLLIRDRADFRLLAWSFVGLAGWQGAVGVHQYLTATGASYQGADIRAVGTFGAQDVMGMATVVALGTVCAVGLALGATSVRHRLLAAGCSLALLPPLALSFSRGAWIATAVTCAVQLLLAGPRLALRVGAAALAASVVLVGGLGVGTTALQERISSITEVTDAPDQSVTDRYTMWAAAAGMWREHPLTGVGLKNFPEYRDGHASLALSSGSETEGAGAAYRRQPLLSPHNMYLLVLSEQGLIGLLALAGSWLALLICALRGLHRLHGGRRGPAGPPDPREAAGPQDSREASGPPGPRPVPGAGAGAASASRSASASGFASGADCALVSCGLLVWMLTDFAYADIGGPSTVLTAVCLGLAGRWALAGDTFAGRAEPHGGIAGGGVWGGGASGGTGSGGDGGSGSGNGPGGGDDERNGTGDEAGGRPDGRTGGGHGRGPGDLGEAVAR